MDILVDFVQVTSKSSRPVVLFSVLFVCACGCSFIPPVDSRSTQLIQGQERGRELEFGCPRPKIFALVLISQSPLAHWYVPLCSASFLALILGMPTLFPHSQYHLRKMHWAHLLFSLALLAHADPLTPKNKILREKSGTFTLMSSIYVSLPHELCRRSKSSKKMVEEMNCKSTQQGKGP